MDRDLQKHSHQNDGKKTHSCNQCGYSTIEAANLKKHMLVHSGEKPFVCKQCNYSCTQAGSLKIHIRTHSGEKPFNCTQCQYSCTSARNLKRHMFIHSGGKPFNCAQCDYSCTTANDLKRHMLTHSGEKNSVNTPAQELVPSRVTYSHIQERSLSGVTSVTIPALMLKISRSTSSNTLEQSPLHFSSAASLPVNLMI